MTQWQQLFFRSASLAAIAGCCAAVLGNIMVVVLNDNVGFVADTISDAAAGRLSWMQDVGMFALAGGVLLLAVGLLLWNPKAGWRWRTATVLLMAFAVSVMVIGAHDAYGDREPGGFVLHIYLVYIFGILFGVVALLTGEHLHALQRGWKRFSLIIAALWFLAAPTYFAVPTAWDGLYERAVAALIVVWVVGAAHMLFRHADAELAEKGPPEQTLA